MKCQSIFWEKYGKYLIMLAAEFCIYSQLLLSRTHLSRITAYLEVKIWSLFSHRDLPTGNKILWVRGEIAPEEQFLLFFHNIFNTSLTWESNLRFILLRWLFD